MKTFRLVLFLFISIFFTFCATKTDKELFDEGLKLINEKSYDKAVITFEEIFTKNESSEFAPTALFEAAKMYQGKVIKNLKPQESLKKAVSLYKSVVEKYPSSVVAENSLFMAGFIQANELKDYSGAKESYELFVKKFPDGQLVDDAKVELSNLGKTPEEILKKNN